MAMHMRAARNRAPGKSSEGVRTLLLLLVLSLAPSLTSAGELVVPEGTKISLQLNNHLDTRVNNEGDSFTAVVIEPVYLGGRIVIPKGSEVSGSIARIIRPGRFKGKAVMNLHFRSISIPGRGQLAIAASLYRLDAEVDASLRSSSAAEAMGPSAADVRRPVMPVGGISGLTGGRKGSGAGDTVGITSVFATRGRDFQVRRGSTMDIVLDKPLLVPLQ